MCCAHGLALISRRAFLGRSEELGRISGFVKLVNRKLGEDVSKVMKMTESGRKMWLYE